MITKILNKFGFYSQKQIATENEYWMAIAKKLAKNIRDEEYDNRLPIDECYTAVVIFEGSYFEDGKDSHIRQRRWPHLVECAGVWIVDGLEFPVHQVKDVIDRDTYEKRYSAEKVA